MRTAGRNPAVNTIKLAEISDRINLHLQRLEEDPVINIRQNATGLLPYYKAHSVAVGRYVRIRYVSYQAASNLSKQDALRYLEALDAGSTEKHYMLFRDK